MANGVNPKKAVIFLMAVIAVFLLLVTLQRMKGSDPDSDDSNGDVNFPSKNNGGLGDHGHHQHDQQQQQQPGIPFDVKPKTSTKTTTTKTTKTSSSSSSSSKALSTPTETNLDKSEFLARLEKYKDQIEPSVHRFAYNPWDPKRPVFPDCKNAQPKPEDPLPSSEEDRTKEQEEWAQAKIYQDKWKVFLKQLKPYEEMRTNVLLLRDLGCILPIELAYVEGELKDWEIEMVKMFGVTPRNITPFVETHEWEEDHKRLGASKSFAITHSSFEQVLFMDTDNYPVIDPTYLFDTPEFKTYGSVYWPDYGMTGHVNKIFWIMEMCHKTELSFESGQVLVDKRIAWKGLNLAMHMGEHAKYYFKMMWGDKDTFHFGYAAARIPYIMSPYYPGNVGTITSDAQPRGNVPLNPDNTLPPNTTFCGQTMLQYDFKGREVFCHANGVKVTYFHNTRPFDVGVNYDFPPGKVALDSDGYYFHWHGRAGEQEHCIEMKPTSEIPLKIWNWTLAHPLYNEKFEAADKLYLLMRDEFKKAKNVA
ncbi:hypothetical protein HDU76_000662 [Blyttiomyces sp. JEL0837]|nr:hypothetical protein HDU76_000662 [Blyttiomyces sp. JEL0837]